MSVLVVFAFVVAEATILHGHAVAPPPPPLELSRAEVVAGRDAYILKIGSLPGQNVSIRYSLNGESTKEFTVVLDEKGQVHIDVPSSTEKGEYRLTSFAKEHSDVWTTTDKTIMVR